MTFAPPNTAPLTHMQIMDAIEGAGAKMESIRSAVGEVIFGQEEVVANSMITILSGGHLLLVGLPGLAKTRLVTTLGKLLGLECKRIQCTPDLMPSDIIGAEVLEEVDYGKRNFRFVQGPIFTQLLMVDEINRASPRTQSALLQAMQEHSASVAGREHALPAPFHVLATQNPLEQEGTYPLPEAQLDRFLMQVDITYPSIEAERKVLLATVGTAEPTLKSILNATELKDLHSLVRRIPLSEKVLDGILGRRAPRPPRIHDARRGQEIRLVGPRPPRLSSAQPRGPRPCAGRRTLCAVDGGRDRPHPPRSAAPHGAQLRRPRRRHPNRRRAESHHHPRRRSLTRPCRM